jgi:DNA-binding NarL/FixJ family response regulator
MKDGADGYLLKEETSDVLRNAIRTIRQGKIYISLAIINS